MKLTQVFFMLPRLLLIALATGMHQPAIIEAWRRGDQEERMVAILVETENPILQEFDWS